jgi:hypothetical protein
MPALELEGTAVRRQLEEILKSPRFARNERQSQLLRFLVERHLDGRDNEIKESVIGVEVFGRTPDYNPKLDPIVRTEAHRLRARLSAYYAGEGARDAIVLQLPKGGYVPAIRASECTEALPASQRAVTQSRLVWLAAGSVITIAFAIAGWTRFTPISPWPGEPTPARSPIPGWRW